MRKKFCIMLAGVFLLTGVSFALTLSAYGSNERDQQSNALGMPQPQPQVFRTVEEPEYVEALVYTDDYVLDPSERYPIVALDNLGKSYVHYADDPNGFLTALETYDWYLVVVSHNNYYEMGTTWTELEQYVQGGGRLVLATFDIDGSHSESTTLWATLGVQWSADMSVPEPVYR